MFPRKFYRVRESIETVIRHGDEQNARDAAVSFVDTWAADVIAAHLGTERFPAQAQAEIVAAGIDAYFGLIGISPLHCPDVSKWVMDCNILMTTRLQYWVRRCARFKAPPRRCSMRAASA